MTEEKYLKINNLLIFIMWKSFYLIILLFTLKYFFETDFFNFILSISLITCFSSMHFSFLWGLFYTKIVK